MSVSTGDREGLLQFVDSRKKLQAQQLLKSQNTKLVSTHPFFFDIYLPSLLIQPLDCGLKFDDITSAMNAYLSPALEHIATALQ